VLDAGRDGLRAGYYDAEHGERDQVKESAELLKEEVIKELKATGSSCPFSRVRRVKHEHEYKGNDETKTTGWKTIEGCRYGE
jgi:hypothetical protein